MVKLHMVASPSMFRRSASRQLHKEGAPRPRNSSTTLMLTRVREMKAQGLSATKIAKALGIGPASIYRVWKPPLMAGLGTLPFPVGGREVRH
jgi:DNA invertase Pin-like site-specific DNA recombinase